MPLLPLWSLVACFRVNFLLTNTLIHWVYFLFVRVYFLIVVIGEVSAVMSGHKDLRNITWPVCDSEQHRRSVFCCYPLGIHCFRISYERPVNRDVNTSATGHRACRMLSGCRAQSTSCSRRM